MREKRSASQILFGFLPQQTVDVAGGIWRVRKWVDPDVERNVDIQALREELIRLARRWEETGRDGRFVNDLRRGAEIKVRSLDRDRGVWLEAFPKLWVCRSCNRIHDEARGRCPCGNAGKKGQFPFVGYHEECGALKEPFIRRCPEHDEVAIRWPGSASAEEIVFFCPVCRRELKRGLTGARCDCAQGGALKFTVHRASSVFTPRSVVVVNPPTQRRLRELEELGGAPAAVNWIVDGLPGRRPGDGNAGPDAATIRRQLLAAGMTPEAIERMLAAGNLGQNGQERPPFEIPEILRDDVLAQAKTIALALLEARTTVDDLRNAVAPGSQLRRTYDEVYPQALRRAGIERVELVDRFPVLTGQFGYTRGKSEPGEARLRTYRERDLSYTVYGDLAQTEALFVRLSPTHVATWLTARGVELLPWNDDRTAASAILSVVRPPVAGIPDTGNDAGRILVGLIHSLCHRFIRHIAVFAGIERSALSELLVPLHFGFFVYAAARGDFVLGGLQAVFETELHELLDRVVHDEHRCPLDPGCSASGGACAVCLHLGEPSCRMFNTNLSRTFLSGGQGYLTF